MYSRSRQVLSDVRESPEDFFARGPHGVFNPRLWGWFHDHALPERRWRIAPRPLIAAAGTDAMPMSDTIDLAGAPMGLFETINERRATR